METNSLIMIGIAVVVLIMISKLVSWVVSLRKVVPTNEVHII